MRTTCIIIASDAEHLREIAAQEWIYTLRPVYGGTRPMTQFFQSRTSSAEKEQNKTCCLVM